MVNGDGRSPGRDDAAEGRSGSVPTECRRQLVGAGADGTLTDKPRRWFRRARDGEGQGLWPLLPSGDRDGTDGRKGNVCTTGRGDLEGPRSYVALREACSADLVSRLPILG